jgi:hypothetical protein
MKQARITIALLLLAVYASAEDIVALLPLPTPAGGITAVVTTVSGNMITVLNGSVAIDTNGATFSGRKGNATIADVKPGTRILATIRNADAAPGTTLQASNIVILDSPAASLNGRVQAVDVTGSSITVLGARIRVTADTRINALTRKTSTLADIKTGDTAAVEVNVTGSTLVAESITVFPSIPNASIEGTVKSIGATTWVIATTGRTGDVTITVNAETKIDTAIKTGDAVRVIGNADASGHITATVIFLATIIKLPEAPLLQGAVKSIAATSWTITTREGKDVTVAITSETKFDPSIKAGDSVRVLTRSDAAGNLIALIITKAETTKTRATQS